MWPASVIRTPAVTPPTLTHNPFIPSVPPPPRRPPRCALLCSTSTSRRYRPPSSALPAPCAPHNPSSVCLSQDVAWWFRCNSCSTSCAAPPPAISAPTKSARGDRALEYVIYLAASWRDRSYGYYYILEEIDLT